MSVDLDEIACYAHIHGLTGVESHAVYDIALERLARFAADLGVPLTLFVIARDLGRAENVRALANLVALGHEIGNHSLDHFYDLTRRTPREQQEQVAGALDRVHSILGVRPSGFRAPGYTATDELLRVVRDAGMRYDSSVFPCPPYYAAKAARLFRMKLRGRHSRAILDSPRVLAAPTVPYRISEPYYLPGSGLLELPIQVAGPLRFPFIGTALTLLGASAARLLTRSLLGVPLVNLELHGLDFLDRRDVPAELHAVQPDLRVPLAKKLEALGAVLELLRAQGYAMVRLDEAARAFA